MRFKLLIRLFRTAIQVDLLARGALVVPHSDGEDLHASLLRSSGADLGARAYRLALVRMALVWPLFTHVENALMGRGPVQYTYTLMLECHSTSLQVKG